MLSLWIGEEHLSLSDQDGREGKLVFDIQEELKKLPARPGVYIMHDEKDTIIYVGKAVSLSILSQILSWRLWFWSVI